MSARTLITKLAPRASLSSGAFKTRTFQAARVGARSVANSSKTNSTVVHFDENGQRHTEELKAGMPPKPPVGDAPVIAQALQASTLDTLTPTLKKFTLAGKVALVTGAGRGLGHSMAQALVEAGVQGLAILDLNREVGERSARQLSEQTGIDCRFYELDVVDEEAVGGAVQDVVSHFGKLDVVINSAGIADSNQPAERYAAERFRRQIDINVTGSFLVAQACAQHMIASKQGGSMIMIASMSGSIVNYPQEQSCYNASKAAVIQMCRSLATEWARHNIRVNAISPGYMDTALNRVPALEAQKKIWVENTPQKRLGGEDELNGLAVYLASDASTFMTGSNCVIDGGFTCW